MTIMNNGLAVIKAAEVEIFARYEDDDLVAVVHKNGYVGIYAEDGDLLMQMSPLMKSSIHDAAVIANRLMGF